MSQTEALKRKPEARYAYYRRCQVFRGNGEQCKAPAEKGAVICHAHAGQQAIRVRRKQQRRAVLAKTVQWMRQRGRQGFEAADIFRDFQGIQAAIAVMAQTLIEGSIDCKTAGRLAVELQMASKLLFLSYKAKAASPTLSAKNAERLGHPARGWIGNTAPTLSAKSAEKGGPPGGMDEGGVKIAA